MEHRFCLDEILGKVSEMINTEKKPPGDGHPSGAYFVLTWKYLLSWLSLVYARFFFLSSFVCMLSVASVRLCKAFFICWCLS